LTTYISSVATDKKVRYKMKEMNIKGKYRDILSRNGEIIADTGWKSNTIVGDYCGFLAALMKKDFEQKVGIEYIAVGSGSDKDSAVFKERVKEFFEWRNSTESDGDSGPFEDGTKGEEGYYWVWAKEITDSDIEYLYLFSWDDVPGKDSDRLLRYLWDDLGIDWAKNAEISKSEDGKTIHISKGGNSAKITIGENETKATLKIGGGRTYDLKVKDVGGKRNIYEYLSDDGAVTNRLKIDVMVKPKEPSEGTFEFREFALLGIDKKPNGEFNTTKMFFINYVDHEIITKDMSMELTRTIELTFPIKEKQEVVS